MAKTEKYSPEIKMKSAEEYQAGKGIYTIDIFTKRNLAFAKEIKQLRESEEDLLKQKNADNQQETKHAQMIPTAQHIPESYAILSVEEKNRLWKLVLKKARDPRKFCVIDVI